MSFTLSIAKRPSSHFSLHLKTVTLLAAVDSGAMNIKDIKGKRVNIENPGFGQRQNSIDALQAVVIDYEKNIRVEDIKASEEPELLQDCRIDAFFNIQPPCGAFK